MAKQYGLIADWEEFQLQVALSAATFASSGLYDPADATASLLTRYQADPTTDPERTGVTMAVISSAQDDEMQWAFEIPDLSISYSDTDSPKASSGTLLAVFSDLKLYAWRELTFPLGVPTETQGWRLDFSQVELFKNAVSVGVWDNSGSGYSLSTDLLKPSAVPLIGIPARVQALCAPGPLFPVGPGGTAFSLESSCTAAGGWRFKERGEVSYTTLPVEDTSLAFTGSCGCGTETPTPPTGTTTWDLTAHSVLGAEETVDEGDVVVCPNPCTPPGPDASYRIDTATLRIYDWFGNITGVPNLERAIARMNSDYGALWHRYELPKCEAYTITTCKEGEDWLGTDATTTITENTSVLNAEKAAQGPVVVNNSTHAVEDTFAEDVIAPFYLYDHELVYTSTYVVEIDPVQLCNVPWTCTPEGEYPQTTYCELTRISQFLGANAFGTGSVSHLQSTSAVARLVDSVASPHWSFAYHFDDWSGLDQDDYWKKCRYQWQDTGIGSRTNKRNSIISCPLNDVGFVGFLDNEWDGRRWIGVPRFKTDEVSALASYTYDNSLDSSMIEDETDCVVTLGASNISVNPSALTSSFKLRLGSFVYGPRLYAHVCDRVRVDWSNTNVSAVRVYLESVDGSRALLEATPGDGFTTKATTYDRPDADDAKYAGSWPINNANGQVSDEGSDSLPEGISAATMADPERCLAFQLLKGYGAKYLVFEIDVVDHASDATIEYPVVYFDTGIPGLTWEHGSALSIVFPNGPGVRLGNHKHYDSGLNATPSVEGLGSHKSTVVDWLVTRRLLFEAVAYDDSLTTELESFYDDVEGNDAETVDGFSLAFQLPMKAADATVRTALVNGWAEVPPLCCFPFRKRTDEWLPTDDHALVSYSFSQEPRYYVSRATKIDVRTGVDNWTSETTAPATGWHKTTHSHAVSNSELATFQAWHGNKEYADVCSWHGYFAVVQEFGQFANPWNWEQEQNHYHRAAVGVEDPGIWYFRAHWGHPAFGFDAVVQVTEDENDSHPRMVCDPLTQSLQLVFTREDAGAFDLMACESNDEGDTWSEPAVLIADGRFPTITVSRDGTMVAAAFKYDSGTAGPGTIIQRVRKMGDTAWSTAAAITDGSAAIAFEADTFHIVQAYLPEQPWVLVARPEGSDDVEEYRSYDDCLTFEII